jgi:glycerophosphoryl diester phosphodiesterase
MTPELLKSKTGRTLIESHRGIQSDLPENSWSAIKLGHQLGADLIEVDLQMSQDCVLFLRHNYQLPDGRWCHELSWNELEELKFEGEPLPKLEDVLVWAREVGTILSLDIKTIFSPEGSLTNEVVHILERTNTKDRVLLLFVDHNELLQTKLAHPELTVRALLRGRLAHYAEYLQKIGADCASLSYGMFRPSDIDQLHSAGISVVLGELWNPNVNLFQTLEIDIFTHGNPVEARKILNHQ